MDDNRRSTFRAPIADDRSATLVIGSRRLDVQLIDESAGGFGVAADSGPEFEPDAVGRLEFDDGQTAEVQAVYVETDSGRIHIGLKRTASFGDFDSRRAARQTNPKILLAGIVIGLVMGFALQWTGLREYFSHLAR